MKKLVCSIFCVLFLSFNSQSFSANNPTFIKKIALQFSKQWNQSQQEKLYLHTDKSYYSAGENIWFKGYVVNATTHLPKSLSKFIYVELLNKANTVVTRVKIKRDSLGFDGYIALKPELPMGNYALRAYTNWMQNAGTDFFFTKNFYIGNPIDDYIKSTITYKTDDNAKITATMCFVDANNKPITDKKVKVLQNWNNLKGLSTIMTTDPTGKINTIVSNDSALKSNKIISVSIAEETLKYENKFYLPEFNTNFDVQFFPESGYLLSNQQQTIGFKAIGSDGLSMEVTGKIFNANNEEVTEFSSLHKGMGKITLLVDSAASYYAVVKSKSGVEKKFNLPNVQQQGISLQIKFSRGKVWYELLNNTVTANQELYLLVHSRGKMLAALPLDEGSGQITESILPAGIVNFSVIDSLGNSYCERLYFARNPLPTIIKSETNKAVYGKREPVEMKFNIQSNGVPCAGNYSVSITDNKLVKPDSLSDNIMSNLLLTSDLKGFIESPASYFTDSIKQDHEKLDVLMLTQGWKRFNTAEILKGKFRTNDFYMEVGQSLSGKVFNLLKKPVKDAKVIMIADSLKQMKSAITDSLGEYLIENISFPDSISFSLQPKKGTSSVGLILVPDEDKFPTSTWFIPLQRPENLNIPTEYYAQSKSKYFWEGGQRVINLESVTVKGNNANTYKQKESYSGSEDKLVTANDLKDLMGFPILQYIATLPGVSVNGEEISMRGSKGNPLLLVNGIESPTVSDFSYYTTDDIENIMIFNTTKGYLFGARGGNGAIAIELKSASSRPDKLENIKTVIKPLGFQQPIHFYVPKYEVASEIRSNKADLRTTIYWNPKLVSDNTGIVSVNFYTADKANNYSVVLEGITEKGEICRFVGFLKRKGE